jgi:hypothetical protein
LVSSKSGLDSFLSGCAEYFIVVAVSTETFNNYCIVAEHESALICKGSCQKEHHEQGCDPKGILDRDYEELKDKRIISEDSQLLVQQEPRESDNT